MSCYEDYEKYPDGTIKDPKAAVAAGNLEETSDGFYNKWTGKVYWPDGTERG